MKECTRTKNSEITNKIRTFQAKAEIRNTKIMDAKCAMIKWTFAQKTKSFILAAILLIGIILFLLSLYSTITRSATLTITFAFVALGT